MDDAHHFNSNIHRKKYEEIMKIAYSMFKDRTLNQTPTVLVLFYALVYISNILLAILYVLLDIRDNSGFKTERKRSIDG